MSLSNCVKNIGLKSDKHAAFFIFRLMGQKINRKIYQLV